MRGLYAIIDVATLARRRLPVVGVAHAILAGRPAAVQLRAKDLTPRETLQLLRNLHPICRAHEVPLFANDRPDLALLAGCEGVHIGQEDLPPKTVRWIAPGLRIGISTHDSEQAERAWEQRPDYVAFGPVFETSSKERPDRVVGLGQLAAVAARSPTPVVAIGGIDLERAREVGRTTHLAAVISALLPEGVQENDLEPITARTRALHEILAAD